MIKYSLVCEAKHGFDGWFRNADDFDCQRARELVACPVCGSVRIEKTLMSPAVSTSRKKEALVPALSNENAAQAPAAEPAPRGGAKPADASLQPSAMLPGDVRQKEILEALRQVRSRIIENSDNVGTEFASEARKIHYGEAEERSIYGQTSPKDAADLIEEGISVLPLPELPEDKN